MDNNENIQTETAELPPKYFSFSDVFKFGWLTMKANFWFFVVVCIVYGFLINISEIHEVSFETFSSFMPESGVLGLATHSYNIFIYIVALIIWPIVEIGIVKITLCFCDEEKPEFRLLFSAKGCFWKYVGLAIIFHLIKIAGFLLFIIPGFVWSVKYGFGYYFVIDKGYGPLKALTASGQTTRGVKWDIFTFNIICHCLNVLGVVCLLFGFFATYPVVLVAKTLVYRQLIAQSPEMVELEPIEEAADMATNETYIKGVIR
jgi:uncharacterized membrane protein